jgi:molecular chaperone DnaK/molecular chaperone HscA
VEVKPTYGLTDEQVENMILESFDMAEQDLHERQVIEAKNEGQTIYEAVEKAMTQPVWQHLTSVEHQDIKAAALELKASMAGDDYRVIRNSIEHLDKKTRRLAEIMMDSAVSGAIGGKTMQAAGEDLGEGPSAPHPFAPAQIDESASTDPLTQAEQNPETPGESTED